MATKGDDKSKAAEKDTADDAGPVTINAADVPDLVNWYEGMLLMPWHFQQSTRRQEGLASWLVQAAAPHGWGVLSLKSSLAQGVFQIHELEAVMPDRMMVRYRAGAGQPPLVVDLRGEFKKRTEVFVHLTAVQWNEEALGYGPRARYRPAIGDGPLAASPDDLAARGHDPDEPPDDTFAETPWMQPILELMSADGPRSRIAARVSLPLARFVKGEAQGESKVAHRPYQPPSLILGAALHQDASAGEATPVLGQAKKVRDALSEKAGFLADLLKASEGSSASDAAAGGPERSLESGLRQALKGYVLKQDQQRLSDLNAVARALPRLHALISDGRATHPRAVFLALCDVLGDLSTVAGKYHLPDALPTYDHRNALASFEAIGGAITEILESLSQKYRVIPFDRVTDGAVTQFVLKDRPETTDGADFLLGAFATPGRKAAVDLWMTEARIGTTDTMPALRKARALGAAREQNARDDELDVASSDERRLYKVTSDRESIPEADRTLYVEGDGDEMPSQLFLYVLRKQPAGQS